MSFPRAIMTRRMSLLAVLPFALACASGGSGGSGGADDEEASSGGNRSLITQAEVAALPPVDGYTAVQRLRPRWLQRRGTGPTPQVRVDGRVVEGGVQFLRQLRSSDISEIRFIDSRDATTQLGTGFSGGLIDVTMKG